MDLMVSVVDTLRRTGKGLSRRRFLGLVGAAAVTGACASSDPPGTSVSNSVLNSTDALSDSGTSTGTSADGPPELLVTFPPEGTVFCGHARPNPQRCVLGGPDLTFEGTVTPGAEVLSGPFVANVSSGQWSITLRLDRGVSDVPFLARGPDGQETTTSVTVTYNENEPSR